ncbi:MAG: acetyl-CoA carboxylase biotin carboxylase subunit [Acidobacteriota bacterium]
MFKKILIANRGEIAVRIIRACRDMGISPAVVYSTADRESLAVKLCDEAYWLGEAASLESYLAIDKIIDAASRCQADAIHPGYGFLAENEEFARACQDSAVTFIGPSAASIQLMGDKISSRTAVKKAGVPVVPGSERGLDSPQEGLSLAAEIGYPVMLKASAGGGGKGLRLLRNEAQFRSIYETARSEAGSSFGDSTVYLEKYIERPRHIEIQLVGDRHANLVHLGERECSVQRRHQKLVEECPSPMANPPFRRSLGEAALAVARAVDYYGAGTVEFLVDAGEQAKSPPFYFLEMNTRLQVEHPVTEMVTGIDLVREQIRVAAGEELGYRQEDVHLRGSALECRIYAEDPQDGFKPSPGVISSLFEPSGPGIRNDSGVHAGAAVPLDYDPLISKLVAHGQDRSQAICRMRRALGEYKISGVRTTIPFFEALLAHPAFLRGDLHTHFIEEHRLTESVNDDSLDTVPLCAAALSFFATRRPQAPRRRGRSSSWRNYGKFDRRMGTW